jgi:5-methyltetrahydrofolate--homocysteine methyltransferase
MPLASFTEDDWGRTLRNAETCWKGELDRPLTYLSVVDPVGLAARRGYFTNYPLSMTADEIVDRYEPLLAATRWYGDAFPYLWCNFGPGMLAGFLGCRVESVTEPAETVWFWPVRRVSIGELRLRYEADNPWRKRVLAVTEAFVCRFERSLVFGHVDLGGNLDVLASFLGTEELLLELTDHPGEVDRLVRDITALWTRYYDEQAAILRRATRGTSTWVPILSTTYMLQSDLSYMISPAMFDRFVMPDLEALSRHLDHAFYHLDGKGEIPHLDRLLSLQRLRGIQWIPGDGQPPPEEWLDLLRRIRDGGKLCQVFVTPEGALRIVRTLGGKGFLFVVRGDYEEFPDAARAQAFLDVLRREDVSLRRKPR